MENLNVIINNVSNFVNGMLGLNSLQPSNWIKVFIILSTVVVIILWIIVLVKRKDLSSKNSFTFKTMIIALILTAILSITVIPNFSKFFGSEYKQELIKESLHNRYEIHKIEFEDGLPRLYSDENTSIIYYYHVLNNEAILDYPKIATRIRYDKEGKIIPEDIEVNNLNE